MKTGRANDPDISQRVLNGFAMLSLDGPDIEEAFFDENSALAWSSARRSPVLHARAAEVRPQFGAHNRRSAPGIIMTPSRLQLDRKEEFHMATIHITDNLDLNAVSISAMIRP